MLRSTKPFSRRITLAILGLLAAWLVIQNTLLLAAAVWAAPHVAMSVPDSALRLGSALLGLSMATLVAMAVGAAIVWVVTRRREPSSPQRAEVRHG